MTRCGSLHEIMVLYAMEGVEGENAEWCHEHI